MHDLPIINSTFSARPFEGIPAGARFGAIMS
jgi:hypothetical protein